MKQENLTVMSEGQWSLAVDSFMRRYWSYLKYVLRHKWFVGVECFKEGLYWQGLVHDMSKFSHYEFIPYAKHFYNKDGSKKDVRNETGFHDPNNTGDEIFDFAWLLHQKRNKHHWQFWILPKDDGDIRILEMPTNYVIEMVCDWVGTGKAQGFVSPADDRYFETRKWYDKNKDKMQLHEKTREQVENIIRFIY
jgi:hypothetical protein